MAPPGRALCAPDASDASHDAPETPGCTVGPIEAPDGGIFGRAPARARIELVGAGPGDPDLLTLAALRAIQRADLVIADRLIPDAILRLVRGELRVAQKSPGHAEDGQDELNRWALAALRANKYVVRLKNGDAYVFGRGAEEVLFFRRHGYEPTVVPGVSSALAAPLAAGIPLTHRGVADQVLITTGRGRGGAVPDMPPYSPTRTTIFLMAAERLAQLARDLVARGYPATTPVAVVERATCEDQRVLRSTLDRVGREAAAWAVQAPATVVVGAVCDVLHQGGARGAE